MLCMFSLKYIFVKVEITDFLGKDKYKYSSIYIYILLFEHASSNWECYCSTYLSYELSFL